LKTGAVEAYHSAHGTGSDSNHDGYAEKFSNATGSNASSLGFAKTVETYISGKFGYALRMKGLSTTNSNIYSRAVVVHGAKYVYDSDTKQGRSYGCPAVSFANRDHVVNTLKGGALIYFGLSK
jgi:L,D-transpeptidase catalytic domain